MNNWRIVSVTVLTASVLLLGVPAGGASAQESVSYSSFDLSGILKEGSKGDNVKIMQRALNKAMGAELLEDGIFGPNTKTAILAFQKSKKNLKADGIYGPNTHAELSKEVNSFRFSITILKVGSRGEAVRTLQKGLKDMNYNVTADGIYGLQTKKAVMKFQERFPELVNDGIFGPKTKTLMDKVLND